MPPVVPDPDKILPFASHDLFYTWLSAHHDKWDELWLKFHKKASGLPTVTYEEAVCAALCWGWIDGIKKAFDEKSYILRFTPRRQKSVWSLVNTRHAERLIAQGLMQAPGHAQIEAAKADGRWSSAYAPAREMEMPSDFLLALAESEQAKAAYEDLNRASRYAIAYRIKAVKRAETRQRKIAEFIAMLERGEKLHP